ncbi:5-azacytidine-induced protein 2 isoform X2 [Osmerus mordax]
MEPPAVEDDIYILKHETAYVAAESPVSVCAGDESVASHFALVTAYEDIKKRLRDTERENTLLRKRVKQLEDKPFRPEAPPSEGPQYVNKAFSAYRGIYMENKELQAELKKLKRERSELEKLLLDQLQAKELELLELKTEIETSQVMKSLNSSQDLWQMGRVNNGLKMHTLQEELERVQQENIQLQEHCGDPVGQTKPDCEQNHNPESKNWEKTMLQSYESLCFEVSHLHSALKMQKDLVKRLKDSLLVASKPAASMVPVQCLDDVEKNNWTVRVSVPRPPSAPPVPSSSGRPGPPMGHPVLDGLREDCWGQGPWSSHCPVAPGSPVLLPPPPQNQASLDDSSWSFPSPPKPSDTVFWEGQNSPPHSSTSKRSSPKSPPY